MAFKNCFQCQGKAKSTIVVKKFAFRDCGHLYCHRCRITHDSDIDRVGKIDLQATDIQSISGEKQYRHLFVEKPTIRNEHDQDYAACKWKNQSTFRAGVAAHAIRSITEYFDDQRPLKILDVGCASGFTSKEMVDTIPNSRVWSIDPSPQVLGMDGYQDRVTAKQATLQAAGFPPEEFDVVVIVGNLMLHSDPFDTIDCALSTLRKDGLLIIDFKNIRSSIRQFCLFMARFKLARFLPQRLFNLNFVNMRYGFHETYLMDFMRTRDVALIARRTKPPRLLEFANENKNAAGWKGLLWRAFNAIDVLRKQQAWVQLEFKKN